MVFFLLVFLITVYWIYNRVYYKNIYELSKYIKTDIKTWPFIGHAYMMLGNSVGRMNGIKKIGLESIKQGGRTHMWLGHHYFVVTTDPVDIDLITKKSLKKGDILDFMKELIGESLLLAPVSVWRPRRKIITSLFSIKNLNSFVDIFVQKSELLINRLQDKVGTNAFPLLQYTSDYSMETISATTLGVSLDNRNPEDQSFFKSFEICVEMAAEHVFRPWLHINYIKKCMTKYQTFLTYKKLMYDFIDKVLVCKKNYRSVESKSEFCRSDDKNSVAVKSFLEMLMVISEKHQLSDEALREETFSMALGGVDTMSSCISSTCFLLSTHPEVQNKVLEEIREVVEGSDRAITAKDLPRLKYLEIVLKENLRLYPPFPIILRQVTENVTLPSGPTLHPGCFVIIHIWGTHRNPQHWGPDANQFRPERFLEDTPRHPAAFIPFSSGTRNCLGYQYAMMSMKTAVATLVRNYRLLPATEPDSEGNYPPLNTEYNIFMKDVDHYKIRLERHL